MSESNNELFEVEQVLPVEVRRQVLRQGFLPLAVSHTRGSLEMARGLLEAGFPSPAFVWAVRSAEIFFREALLFPLWYEETGDIGESFEATKRFLESGKWERAMRRVQAAYDLTGVNHEARMEDGGDAWAYWRRAFVGPRGEVVHGRREATREEAEAAIAFVERMREWFTVRIMSAEQGPFAGLLVEVMEKARAAYMEERERSGDEISVEDELQS